ncbi:hypothetical protein K443DRAFT_217601 [Laccaria amethystina LaAM-08-1]|uniref:Uncharacterized protein n=1 Tax=Laccaria amethystina LaAM-08-1 TaxID=1095629 RepID=A0A0C9YGJ2_9AGAR|nr:hypothetical protein K443DRAFT_217601 [Laccaria amethystina LaAM-08-1]
MVTLSCSTHIIATHAQLLLIYLPSSRSRKDCLKMSSPLFPHQFSYLFLIVYSPLRIVYT